MNGFERGTILFQYGNTRFGLIPGSRALLLLSGMFAVSKYLIVEPAALFECLPKSFRLLLGWENPILKHLSHAHEYSTVLGELKQYLKQEN